MKSLRNLSIALFFVGALSFASPLKAQVDTSKSCDGESCCITECLSKNSFSSSGFGAPMGSYTSSGLGGSIGVGGGGGLLFNCGCYVGAYGKGSSVSKRAEAYNGEELDIKSSEAGLMIGGHPFMSKPVHPKWGLQVGYGSVEGTLEDYVDGEHDLTVMEDDVFVIKPDMGVGIRVCSSLLVDISAGYRFVKGLQVDDKLDVGAKDMNGFQGSVGLKFTNF